MILKTSKMVKVEGVVYCHDHTEVHEDTRNPYGEGPESWCRKSEHRPVYYRARKGDYDD
jgi:histidinol phosphatase-like enzyme